jgi:penicillin-binding protein-related factor A (putative recombinase)
MIQPKTLDDFKNQKIPFYYKASKPKKIPLEVQNEKILEHLRTHTIYKICAFVFVFYQSFSFFNYLKFSRFLKISKANFDAEKRQKIRDTIIENEY